MCSRIVCFFAGKEHSLILLRDGNARPRIFSVLRNSAHSNVAELFNEDSRRLPEEDSLLVLDGIVGAYPNMIFALNRDEEGVVARNRPVAPLQAARTKRRMPSGAK